MLPFKRLIFLMCTWDHGCVQLVIRDSTTLLSTMEIPALMRKSLFKVPLQKEAQSVLTNASIFLCGCNLYFGKLQASPFYDLPQCKSGEFVTIEIWTNNFVNNFS